MPGRSGVTVVTMLVCLLSHLHMRLRVHQAPGFPAPSLWRVRNFMANLGRMAPRECESVFAAVGWAKRQRAHHLTQKRWARRKCAFAHPTQLAMPGLDPGIH